MNTTCRHETNYVTDMTDTEWEIIRAYVEPDPPIASPCDVCIWCVVNALFYLVKTGCQWKMLPTNVPNYGTVYHHFRRWSTDGILTRIAYDLQCHIRQAAGQDTEPSRGIVNNQSTRPAEAGGERDVDAAKRIKGRKRFIITDTMGFILALAVTHAAISDIASAPLLGARLGVRPRLRQFVTDQGFKTSFRTWWNAERGITVETVPRAGHGFQLALIRWIVERTLRWLSFYRRVRSDDEY